MRAHHDPQALLLASCFLACVLALAGVAGRVLHVLWGYLRQGGALP